MSSPPLAERVRALVQPGDCLVALTGAGISVESGIPDFRSPGGIWSRFRPDEYATLEVFLQDPDKAWVFYRELGKTLLGKKPNAAHLALARLEREGRLAAVVTQNVDGLHQAAGNRVVVEVHGEHRNLHCLRCQNLEPVRPELLEAGPAPRCRLCGFPLKPNVVLFGEAVQRLDQAQGWMDRCDVLLVVGTSAQVFPVADFPYQVMEAGGKVLEFNREETELTPRVDLFWPGSASRSLPAFAELVLGADGS